MSDFRVALVTGGAYGIGRGIVQEFSKKGDAVVIADRDAERGSSTGVVDQGCRQARSCLSPPTFAVKVQIQALMKRTEETFGRIDVLCQQCRHRTLPSARGVHARRLECYFGDQPAWRFSVCQICLSFPEEIARVHRQYFLGAGVRQ